MKRRSWSGVLLFAALLWMPDLAHAQERVLDDFEDITKWEVVTADGVDLHLQAGEGRNGQALRMDFDFKGSGGYAVARAPISVELAENYQFNFYIRAEAPVNTFEFKLVDPTGENVWWVNRQNFAFPSDWTRIRYRKRHIDFAWGPVGGGDMEEVGFVEFVVTASTGGNGSVYIDDFMYTPLEPVTEYDLTPSAVASSTQSGSDPAAVFDEKPETSWHSEVGANQQFDIDFLKNREYGGLTLDWDIDDYATAYDVQVSQDGEVWETLHSVQQGDGGRDYLYLPETEARYLRLALHESSQGQGYGLQEVTVQPLDFAASPNAFFEHIASEAPAGFHPKYFQNEQVYWTLVGVSGDDEESLMDTEGRLELKKSSFSVEPFLYVDDALITWNDVERTPSLAEDYLPIPTVSWQHEKLNLDVTAWGAGKPGASVLYARYKIRNTSDAPQQGTLYLAMRPFQVNPPWQFLNTQGGTARIDEIEYDSAIKINGQKVVMPMTLPDGFGAAAFESGNIVDFLAEGTLPTSQSATDALGFSSGAFAFDFDLAPGAEQEVLLALPYHEAVDLPSELDRAEIDGLLAETVAEWEQQLDHIDIDLPDEAQHLVNTIKSNVAYILINRDGPAIQPGSRSYERSWIRDGALTSTALLQMGFPEVVKDFIEWYAPYQYENGKIPCCVDRSGAGPVPEHDSHGQFIYLVAEYYRYTSDADLVRAMWPHIVKAVAYIDELRQQRRTPEYQTPEKNVFYGLVPESISHEGYSAKPMHSYWDDLFVLKGLKDAAFMAEVLGEDEQVTEYAAMRDDFRDDLYASMRRALEIHDIDYLPGAADIGDFDATSTTVGVDPVGELGNLPEPALQRTFEKYYEHFVKRRDGTMEWENYTPYELRVVGTFLRLGWKDRAHEALTFFFGDQRPAAWNHWAEVVWRDPETNKFIGDMPHTWVGSDYIRSVRNFFVYERDADEALVLGAGVRAAWMQDPDGIRMGGLPTYYGPLSYTMQPDGDAIKVHIEDKVTVPPGGLVLRSPLDKPIQQVIVNGEPIDAFSPEEVILHSVPAEVILQY